MTNSTNVIQSRRNVSMPPRQGWGSQRYCKQAVYCGVPKTPVILYILACFVYAFPFHPTVCAGMAVRDLCTH